MHICTYSMWVWINTEDEHLNKDNSFLLGVHHSIGLRPTAIGRYFPWSCLHRECWVHPQRMWPGVWMLVMPSWPSGGLYRPQSA